jgi:predicted HD superfamily hydrolase involved in NAD metabolism
MKNQKIIDAAGVPETLTIEFARDWVRERISEKRFRHSAGVAETARELAARCNCNEFLAELGGWLHDCCKEVKDKELIERAKNCGLVLHPVEELNGHLLHGPVAAETVRRELGLTNTDVLNAIAEHTLGAVNMTTLSKIVFLADAIEPGRSKDYVKPIWQALHPCVWPEPEELLDGNQPVLYGLEALKLTGKVPPDLDRAVLVACDLGLEDLVKSERYIHPKTVDVRNFYLSLTRKSQA